MKRIASLREQSNDKLNSRLVEIRNSLHRAVGKSKAGYDSPFGQNVMKQFKLCVGDKLEWELEARHNQLIIVVTPLKASSGKTTVSTENIKDSTTATQ